MHETSLNQVITDYITGSKIEATTYEDLRQSIARILVEDKKYPKEAIKTKVPLRFDIQGKTVEYEMDFLVHVQGKPALLVAFCPGAVASYLSQYVAAARIVSEPPPPLVYITDTKEGMILRTADGQRLGEGFSSLPDYKTLQDMVETHACPAVDEKKKEQAKNLVHAFFALSSGCCSDNCS